MIRDFTGAHGIFVWHYFSGAESLYNKEMIERRSGSLIVVINQFIEALIGKDPFLFKPNMAGGRLGIRPLVFILASLWMLVYEDTADLLDQSLQISETAGHDSIRAFSRLIIENFGPEYLNK